MPNLGKHLSLFGFSLEDYCRMYQLSDDDLAKSILDVGAGASSFNAQMQAKGRSVISYDEYYGMDKSTIQASIQANFQTVSDEIQDHPGHYVWKGLDSLNDLIQHHEVITQQFLNDYEAGLSQGRYHVDSLDKLPFNEKQFDLALCTHYLFDRCKNQGVDYYIHALTGLLSVANEVRIYPLLDAEGNIADVMNPVMLALQQLAFSLEVKEVPFAFQKGGNAMLRIWPEVCVL